MPLAPTRVLDTRSGFGGCNTVQAGYNLSCYLSLASVLPATATAVVLNVTGTDATRATYVRVLPWESGNGDGPSSLNLLVGETRANQVTVQVTAQRALMLWNFAGSVDLIADVEGYYVNDGSGAGFTSVNPVRVLDTRNTNTPVTGGKTVTVDFSAYVPAGTTAVTFNLTATDVTQPTYVTAYPAGASSPPTVSNLNLVNGDVRSNLVTVELSTDRKVTLYNFKGSVDLIVDLAGSYRAGAGMPFYAYTPMRALDTRDYNGNPTTNTLGRGGTYVLDTSRWLPTSAQAVVFNFTGTNTTSATYLTAYPDGTSRPLASNVNLAAGQTVPNLTVTAIGSDHKIDLYNFAGNTDVIVDIAGYFAAPPTPCATGPCLYSWGSNGAHGSLGLGITGGDSPSTAQQVPLLSGVTAVSGGGSEGGLALRSDGTVWVWGQNLTTSVANSGNGQTGGFSTLPVQITGLPAVIAVAGSGDNGAALATDGTLWGWGQYYTETVQTAPVQAAGLSGIVSIAADGETILALRSDGTVWAWGSVVYDLAGNGGSVAVVPVQVPGLTGITSISLSNARAMAVDANGSVWEWGNFTGTGEGIPPTQVPGLTGMSTAVANAQTYYAVRKSDGSVWAWGDNTYGQLGNGTTGGTSTTPVQVSGVTGVTAIAAADGDTATVRKSDGTVWNWGTGLYGPPSSGPQQSDVPVQVPALTGATSLAATGDGTNYAVLPN